LIINQQKTGVHPQFSGAPALPVKEKEITILLFRYEVAT
jgi:hypothetical protein